jgi:hypothetical protein
VRALHAGTMNGLRVESVVSSSFKASENIAVVIRRLHSLTLNERYGDLSPV